MLIIRPAQENDLSAITEIFNWSVLNTLAIWTEETVDIDNRKQWMKERLHAGFPILVAEKNGMVCGYASYGYFHAFSGYRHSAELSVYVAPAFHRHAIGKKLMTALIDIADTQNIHVLIAAIEAGNTASIKLHAKLGFQETGRMPEVGKKFGHWLELVFMQKILKCKEIDNAII